MLESSRRTTIWRLGVLAAAGVLLPLRAIATGPYPVAIKGYDPVAYFTLGKPTRGRQNIWYEWDERRYMFGKPVGPKLFQQDLAKNITSANQHRGLVQKR